MIAGFFSGLAKDQNGAALLQYTVLLGVLLVASIGTIGWVGGWIGSQWTALDADLIAAGAPDDKGLPNSICPNAQKWGLSKC